MRLVLTSRRVSDQQAVKKHSSEPVRPMALSGTPAVRAAAIIFNSVAGRNSAFSDPLASNRSGLILVIVMHPS
jgi:hypothetical protein